MTTALEEQASVGNKVPAPQSIPLASIAVSLSSSSSPSASPPPPAVLSTKDVTTIPSTSSPVAVPIVSTALVLSPLCVSSSMTTPIGNGQHRPSALLTPPSKRRRGGRKASNPQISAEERKRQRVLKNRESAMRSLAKKAQFSAMLEKEEADALLQVKASEHTLQKLVHAAISIRSFLDKVPDDITDLITQVDNAILRGTDLLEGCIDHGVADALSQKGNQSNTPNANDTS